MTITLSFTEIALAAQVGVRRHLTAIKEKHKTRYQPHDWWGVEINGVCGEMAVAKAFGVFWEPHVLAEHDVVTPIGKFQVRATPHKSGHLLLHDDDKAEATFILVTGGGATRDFDLVGWIVGVDGKRPEYWQQGASGIYDFFVPQSALRPMDELLQRKEAPHVTQCAGADRA